MDREVDDVATFAVATACVCVTGDVGTTACAVDAVSVCTCLSAVSLAGLVACGGSVPSTVGGVDGGVDDAC